MTSLIILLCHNLYGTFPYLSSGDKDEREEKQRFLKNWDLRLEEVVKNPNTFEKFHDDFLSFPEKRQVWVLRKYTRSLCPDVPLLVGDYNEDPNVCLNNRKAWFKWSIPFFMLWANEKLTKNLLQEDQEKDLKEGQQFFFQKMTYANIAFDEGVLEKAKLETFLHYFYESQIFLQYTAQREKCKKLPHAYLCGVWPFIQSHSYYIKEPNEPQQVEQAREEESLEPLIPLRKKKNYEKRKRKTKVETPLYSNVVKKWAAVCIKKRDELGRAKKSSLEDLPGDESLNGKIEAYLSAVRLKIKGVGKFRDEMLNHPEFKIYCLAPFVEEIFKSKTEKDFWDTYE